MSRTLLSIGELSSGSWHIHEEQYGEGPAGEVNSGKVHFGKVHSAEPLPAEGLSHIYASAFAKDAPVYSRLMFPAAAYAYKALPGAELLSKPVMSSTEDYYASFVQSLHAADWVHIGREEYLEKTDGICPFCGQPLPTSFEESLHRLFDDAFEAQMSALRSYEYAFKTEMNRIRSRKLLRTAVLPC